MTVTPYGDRLEPKTKEFVPDLVIQNVLELSEILLPTTTGDDNSGRGGTTVEEARSMSRPFRSLSTGNATQRLEGEDGHRTLDKTPRRFAMSLLADMDSCSSSSSSAEFS